jgi:hypothetical protein
VIFRHSGDLGDIIYALGVISLVPGGPHRLCLVDRPFTANLTGRADTIIPLILDQQYIESCECSEEPVDFDMSSFRPHYKHTHTLLDAQYEHLSMEIPGIISDKGRTKWLTAKPAKGFSDRVIFARSPRYNNDHLDWRLIASRYRGVALFVGTDAEHETFCRNFGDVDRLLIKDYKELAEAIAGCSLFIGNQSSPFSIAEGLKVRRIQETAINNPDCVFTGGDVQHVVTGNYTLPCVGKIPEYKVPPIQVSVDSIDTSTVPPGGWKFTPEGGEPVTSISLSSVIGEGKRHGYSREDVIIQNVRDNYQYFIKSSHSNNLSFVDGAFANAGLEPNYYPTFK